MPTPPPRIVAFDLMDTVVRDPYREALETATGLAVGDLFARRDATAYPRFERDELSEAAYWQVYREAGIDVDVERFHATRRAGYRWVPACAIWSPAWAGTCTGWWPRPPLDRRGAETSIAGVFDDVHASCHLGVRKPDPDFYTRLLRRLDASWPAAEPSPR